MIIFSYKLQDFISVTRAKKGMVNFLICVIYTDIKLSEQSFQLKLTDFLTELMSFCDHIIIKIVFQHVL